MFCLKKTVSRILEAMPRKGDNIHIPLNPDEVLRLLMKVRPTAEMPRPGANPTKPKRAKAKRKKAQ